MVLKQVEKNVQTSLSNDVDKEDCSYEKIPYFEIDEVPYIDDHELGEPYARKEQ